MPPVADPARIVELEREFGLAPLQSGGRVEDPTSQGSPHACQCSLRGQVRGHPHASCGISQEKSISRTPAGGKPTTKRTRPTCGKPSIRWASLHRSQTTSPDTPWRPPGKICSTRRRSPPDSSRESNITRVEGALQPRSALPCACVSASRGRSTAAAQQLPRNWDFRWGRAGPGSATVWRRRRRC